MNLPDKIKEIRTLKKLTQEDLANACCVTRSTISNWEAGRRKPDWESLIIIAELFNIPIEELLGKKTINQNNNQIMEDEVPKESEKVTSITVIINVFIALVTIILLFLSIFPVEKSNKNIFVENNFVENFDNVSLRLKNIDDSIIYNFELQDIEAENNTLKKFYIQNLQISKDILTKYYFNTSYIILLDIIINYNANESLLINTKRIVQIDDQNNKIQFYPKYNIPILTEPGIYNIVFYIENGWYYIGAFMK